MKLRHFCNHSRTKWVNTKRKIAQQSRPFTPSLISRISRAKCFHLRNLSTGKLIHQQQTPKLRIKSHHYKVLMLPKILLNFRQSRMKILELDPDGKAKFIRKILRTALKFRFIRQSMRLYQMMS